MIDELIERLRHGDRAALSRLLSLASQGTHTSAIMRGLSAPPRPGRVIALTGSGGVGKSTLLGKLIERARSENQNVAVLACDPQSPITGGALLGDRLRMGSQVDDGVFIRSLATPGARGAVAENLPALLTVLEAFGFGLIFLETVGAGQGDTAVADLANLVVLLIQPESGDTLQWEKAGVLEVADIVVVHKADLPGAEQTAAELRAAIDLGKEQIPVVLVSSKTGAGLDELWQRIKEPRTQ